MNRLKCSLISLTAILVWSTQYQVSAQPQPSAPPQPSEQPSALPPSAPPQPSAQPQPVDTWFSRVKGSFQGEIWENGKVLPASTTLGFFNPSGGIYFANDNGTPIVGDILQCQTKSERTVQCQWAEGNQTGVLEATFSQNFSSFEGYKQESNSTTRHPWRGTRS